MVEVVVDLPLVALHRVNERSIAEFVHESPPVADRGEFAQHRFVNAAVGATAECVEHGAHVEAECIRAQAPDLRVLDHQGVERDSFSDDAHAQNGMSSSEGFFVLAVGFAPPTGTAPIRLLM